MKKILILEDDALLRKQLVQLAKEADGENQVFDCDNVGAAYQAAMEKNIDLFLTDIILDRSKRGDVSGLKFVESIRKLPQYEFVPVVMITSLMDERLYAYEKLHCYTFMEKPFVPEKVKQTIQECLRFSRNSKKADTLYFRKDGIILAVEQEDIVYAESVKHSMYLHTKQGEVLEIPYLTVKKLLEELDSEDFLQCNRSTVFNRHFMRNVDFTNQFIQLTDNSRLEIGMIFKKDLRERFQ